MMKDYTIIKCEVGITIIGRPLKGVPGHNRAFWIDLKQDGSPSCVDCGICEPLKVKGSQIKFADLHPQTKRQVRIWLRTYLDE